MLKKTIQPVILMLLFVFSLSFIGENEVLAAKNDITSEQQISSNSNKARNKSNSSGSLNLKSLLSTPLPLSSENLRDPSSINDSNTVHVSTANEFLDAVYNSDDGRSTATYRTSSNSGSHVQKIVLDNDINFADSTYSEYNSLALAAHYTPEYVKHEVLVIDGQGHKLDMNNNSISIENNQNQTWTLENMTVTSSSYWGPIRTNISNININYSNISYYGSQLIWSSTLPNIKVNIYGNVSVHSLYSYSTFTKKNPTGVTLLCDAAGNQQNMQTGDLELHAGAKYYGETYNGNVLELAGNLTLDEGATMELHPHGISAEDSPRGGSGYGIYLINANAIINLSDDSQINIDCDNKYLVAPSIGNNTITVQPNNPDYISPALYSQVNSKIQMNGKNSNFNINVVGSVYGNNPAAFIVGMTQDISNSSNFSVNVSNPGVYNPTYGVVYIGNNSNINVNENGGFEVKTDPLVGGYLMYMPYANFNITRPRSFLLDNGGSPNSKILFMNNDQYINAQDIIASANGYSYDGKQAISFSDIPLHKMFLANVIGQYFSYQKIRTFGRYKDLYNINQQLLNATDSGKNYTREFNKLQFTKSPNPTISMTKRYTDKTDPKLTGSVKDDDGNVLVGAYVRIYLDDDKNNKDKYISPINSLSNLSDDDIANIINSKTILTSASKTDIPTAGTGNGTSFSNKTIKTSDFTTATSSSSQYNQFNNYLNANGALSTAFNNISTVYENYPYVAITDKDGNFSFNVPDSVWDKIGSSYKLLDVIASYNGGNSNVKQVGLNNRPNLSIDNNMKDLTYANSNIDGNNLKYVYQGSSIEDGDILQFNNLLKNNSPDVPINNFTYIQPVPSSMDTDSLQISYDDGNTFVPLTSDKYKVTDTNYLSADGSKTENYKNICLNNISLSANSSMNISIKGTLQNKDGKYGGNNISFSPYILDGTLDSDSDNYYSYVPAKGKEDNISYSSGDSFNFVPEDITFGNVTSYKRGWVSGKSVEPNNLALKITDNRREKNNIKMYVSQQDDYFVNEDNSNYKFENKLVYKNGDSIFDLSQSPYQIINSSNPQSIYWNDNQKIMMKMNLNSQPAGKYTTTLTWTSTDSL